MDANHYAIGDVAGLAGVSVRTLHHYDEIGLLSPSGRTAAGHRRYDDGDLARLRSILFYRELDFGLDVIATLLADPETGVSDRLRSQHRLLRERVERHQRLLAALEKEMETREMGMALTPEEQFEVFGTDKVGGEWADEARERWGDTEQYRESQRRAVHYTKDDWARMKAESDAAMRAWGDVMRSGLAADSEPAMLLAEEHRRFIGEWFYHCDYPMHRDLARMYVSDERFRATFDALGPGVAQYVHDAIVANADAHGSGEMDG